MSQKRFNSKNKKNTVSLTYFLYQSINYPTGLWFFKILLALSIIKYLPMHF